MSSKSQLIVQQCQWAEARELKPDARGYLATVEGNLFQPMNEFTRKAFDNGSGSELQDTRSRPAKMKALHSSSALAVNFFDNWVGKKSSALSSVLGLRTELVAIKFEEQLPTGLPGNPPNLDVVLKLSDGHVVGIESKFSEWLTPKSKGSEPFKPKYFPEGHNLWKERFLPRAQQLAKAIKEGEESFRYLDAPQLLKHALGMATQLEDQFSLFYIYYDISGVESAIHSQEIKRFAALVDDGLGFMAISYQDLFSSLNKKDGIDESYMSYMRDRYFSNEN
jgi:hypothetical protein